MGRPRAGDRPSASFDLEVIDPDTGEAPAQKPTPAGGVRPPRARRLRTLALLLGLASLASALGAASIGSTIRTLRSVERAWSEAMALDQARQRADSAVLKVRGRGR